MGAQGCKIMISRIEQAKKVLKKKVLSTYRLGLEARL
jgi:hypothetical protein